MNEENDLKYSYSSKPRVVQTNRSAKMLHSHKALPPNIMHDPRILRGSAFVPHSIHQQIQHTDVHSHLKKSEGIIRK
jgi:hypothetical protein